MPVLGMQTLLCDNAAKPEGAQVGAGWGPPRRHEESPSDSSGPTPALPRAGVPLNIPFLSPRLTNTYLPLHHDLPQSR